MSKTLILVPARFGSTRFPGKPLALINGKPMIHYIIENCQKSAMDFAIVTDDPEIEKTAKQISDCVVRVDDDVVSGSERIALAYQRFFKDKNYEYVINLQGDEPLIDDKTLMEIAKNHVNSNFDIFTAVKKRNSEEEDFANPNIVKAVIDESTHKCFYFSRSSVPFNRSGKAFNWYQHIGIYSYKVDALEKFVTLPEHPLEQTECLEQLRALAHNQTIGACTIDIPIMGVDMPEDIHKLEGVLSEK